MHRWVVDALFGTGLSRPLETPMQDALMRLVRGARLSLAMDLPSGVATDDGALLGDVPMFDLTLALGAIKPAHVLQPAASRCGHGAADRYRRRGERQSMPRAHAARSRARRRSTRTNIRAGS